MVNSSNLELPADRGREIVCPLATIPPAFSFQNTGLCFLRAFKFVGFFFFFLNQWWLTYFELESSVISNTDPGVVLLFQFAWGMIWEWQF